MRQCSRACRSSPTANPIQLNQSIRDEVTRTHRVSRHTWPHERQGLLTNMNNQPGAYRITNCSLGESCSGNWETLETTASDSVRHCDTCQRTIHLCATLAEVLHHAGLEHTMAFKKAPRTTGFDTTSGNEQRPPRLQ